MSDDATLRLDFVEQTENDGIFCLLTCFNLLAQTEFFASSREICIARVVLISRRILTT